MIDISLRQLEVFVETARQGHLTAAAERIFLTQSAASMSLKELERALGGPVFHRVGRGLVLNDRGRMLLGRAEAILAGVQDLLETARNEQGVPAGRVILGCSTTIACYDLPERVMALREVYPEVEVVLRVGNTYEIAQCVRSGEVDLGLVEGPVEGGDLDEENWLRDELIAVAPPAHRLSRARRVSLAQLAAEPWIMREEGSGTRRTVEQALETHGVRLGPVQEIGNTEAIKRAVEAGLGLSWLSRIAVEREIIACRLVRLAAPVRIERWFRMLSVPGRYQSLLVRRVREWLASMRDAT